MENPLNQTQTTPETSNPQDAVPADGASNGADFQSTAPQEALGQEAENLTVQDTGEPLQGTTTAAVDNGFSVMVLLVAGLILGGLFILYKLVRESVEEGPVSPAKPATTKKPAATKSKPAKKPVKKKTASGKPQTKKKTTRKKR